MDLNIPEPEREPLTLNTKYYIPDLTGSQDKDKTLWYEWRNDWIDKLYMERGLVHLTEQAALDHCNSLLSLTTAKTGGEQDGK